MSNPNVKQLHWTQRIALIRHNLQAASRSGDFSFFKSLQAAGLMESTNHFATLTATLGDDADALLAGLDNLNGALAFVHQDAFQSVYDNLKDSMRDEDKQADRSKLWVDITMQKNKAEMAIDKLSNSAIALINQTPVHAQDQAANVYITGLTLVADCVEVMFKQFETLDQKMDDFIRLEEGVFYTLDVTDPQGEKNTRNLSISSATRGLFRRVSNAFQSPPTSRSASVTSAASGPSGSIPVYSTLNFVRNSISAGCPTSMPSSTPAMKNNFAAHNFNKFQSSKFQSHTLSTIPPTPAYEEEMDPFDTTVPPVPALPIEQRRMSQAVM